ncbi:gamma-glutamyl-gamma-aminobutyrate hydrolase family protein [Xanthobacter agilis]|uniref:Gamma-glutamyl-gamma-aminobutyrate hydrolase PuuD n=1 Tax=Xanthobacter agilis TaxID=47492 RepID=A0ABU0L8N3_XANAG|nr:gamma-glutamyl-gamma-aminobutyrate hydrolase family protein [Xanthobacter agilis]MDQ0503476.1 gamma-glutamyl-gamma-aminobutyrate hydrolase PuuD [Xanthobacter agilis]
MAESKPLVAMVGDLKDECELPYFMVGEKYVRAVYDFADCLPVMALPVMAPDAFAQDIAQDIATLIDRVDGFFFTGSPSNVHPSHWNGPEDAPGPFDPARDRFALALIRAAVARGIPSLFICRGFQEFNVALGGTLHARLADVPGRMGHHAPEEGPLDLQYGPLHEVELTAGSPLDGVFGARRFAVNSLHYQGLDTVGAALSVEALAPDGTIEAVSLRDHPFAVGVQWHPEYKPAQSAPNARLLAAFGAAVRAGR